MWSKNKIATGWFASIFLHVAVVLIILWSFNKKQISTVSVAPSIFAEVVTTTSFEQKKKSTFKKTAASENVLPYDEYVFTNKTKKEFEKNKQKLFASKEKISKNDVSAFKIARSTSSNVLPTSENNIEFNRPANASDRKSTNKKSSNSGDRKSTKKKSSLAGNIEEKRISKNNFLPNQIRNTSSFTAPRLSQKFNNIPPGYPRSARQNGVEGSVVLLVSVNKYGVVDSLKIEISSGAKLLDKAAKNAVSQWRFIPAKISDVAVSSKIRVPITFRLQTN